MKNLINIVILSLFAGNFNALAMFRNKKIHPIHTKETIIEIEEKKTPAYYNTDIEIDIDKIAPFNLPTDIMIHKIFEYLDEKTLNTVKLISKKYKKLIDLFLSEAIYIHPKNFIHQSHFQIKLNLDEIKEKIKTINNKIKTKKRFPTIFIVSENKKKILNKNNFKEKFQNYFIKELENLELESKNIYNNCTQKILSKITVCLFYISVPLSFSIFLLFLIHIIFFIASLANDLTDDLKNISGKALLILIMIELPIFLCFFTSICPATYRSYLIKKHKKTIKKIFSSDEKIKKNLQGIKKALNKFDKLVKKNKIEKKIKNQ